MLEQERFCFWAQTLPSRSGSDDDLMIIRESIKEPDGSERTELRLIHNFKRPYWIAKPDTRTYKQKRQFEYIENLDVHYATQTGLARAISKSLGGPTKGFLRLAEVCRSPYVYGATVTAPVIARHHYLTKWPNYKPRGKVAVFDFETDMINECPPDAYCEHDKKKSRHGIIGSLTCESVWALFVIRDFVKGLCDPEAQIRAMLEKHMADDMNEVNAKFEFHVVDDAYDLMVRLQQRAIELEPDWMTGWNIDYDVSLMIEAVRRAGGNPDDVLTDTRIPREFRRFRWKPGPTMMKKANGKTTPIPAPDRWHGSQTATPFMYADSMCFYRLKRKMAGQMETSYSLDAIANKVLKKGKLKLVPELDEMEGASWHYRMQRDHKVEYMVYAIADSVRVEQIQRVTKDLAVTLPAYCGVSEIGKAKSNPHRLGDYGHFFSLEQGRVLQSTSDNMSNSLDAKVMSRNGIIITLPSDRVVERGNSVVIGVPDNQCRISVQDADDDVGGAYPTATDILNASPGSSMIEPVALRGRTTEDMQRLAINYTSIPTNAVELARELYDMPNLDELDRLIHEHINKVLSQ